MSYSFELTGQRFGRLVVIEQIGKYQNNLLWRCKCDCGNERTTIGTKLRTGKVRSCGCLVDEMRRRPKLRHGHAGNPKLGVKPSGTYSSWKSMISRCTYPSHPSYLPYKNRGITVCGRWRESFENFLADMGERPGGNREYTLDRINNDKGYEPGNCRWATPKEQAANRSDDRHGENNPVSKLTNEQVIAIRADTRLQRQIAQDYGVCQQQISRIKRSKDWKS